MLGRHLPITIWVTWLDVLLDLVNFYCGIIDGERSDKSVIIAGCLLGALAVILLILLTAVGTVIFIKKGT